MARKKPARKKPTKKNIGAAPDMMRAVQSYLSGATQSRSSGKRNVSVDELIALAEQRLDSDEAKKAFEDHVAASTPGTVGAAKLVTAADAIEDEDLLLYLVNLGFLEALRSHTMRRRIGDEVLSSLDDVANAQAAIQWSRPDDRYPGAWTVAEFGDVIAVNGTILNDDDRVPDRPKNLVLTDRGGRVPVTEEIVDPRSIVSSVAKALGVTTSGADHVILDVLVEENPHGIPASVSGETEVWMNADENHDAGFDVSVVEER